VECFRYCVKVSYHPEDGVRLMRLGLECVVWWGLPCGRGERACALGRDGLASVWR
jgi:hypothetical protein